jgi:UV DNA damage endonuclease
LGIAASTIDGPRLGFCCKFVSEQDDRERARRLNVTSVTMAYLTRLGGAAAYDKVSAVVAHNLDAIERQIAHVAARPKLERLHRLSSDLLPGYTHPVGRPFYQEPDLRGLIESRLAAIGRLARETGVRLSMHPGQFCVIASANPTALSNGVAEFEYHAEVMTLMGYGEGWHPHGAHINIHAGARAVGAEGFRQGLGRLSAAARNLITVENDEIGYGLDDLLPLADLLPIVLDLHHHWCFTVGEHIAPGDPRIARIAESWRGTRPLGHLSAPREDLLPAGLDPDVLPDYAALRAAGLPARELRRHSDRMWNRAINAWALGHLDWMDIEVEAKAKNLASHDLAEAARSAACPPARPRVASGAPSL